jgi:hypothetical protein
VVTYAFYFAAEFFDRATADGFRFRNLVTDQGPGTARPITSISQKKHVNDVKCSVATAWCVHWNRVSVSAPRVMYWTGSVPDLQERAVQDLQNKHHCVESTEVSLQLTIQPSRTLGSSHCCTVGSWKHSAAPYFLQ